VSISVLIYTHKILALRQKRRRATKERCVETVMRTVERIQNRMQSKSKVKFNINKSDRNTARNLIQMRASRQRLMLSSIFEYWWKLLSVLLSLS